MKIIIKITLHAHQNALEPIFETECRFDINEDQSMQYLEEILRFIMDTQLQKEQKCASVSANE